MKHIYITFAISLVFSLNTIAQRSTFTVDNSGYYIERQKPSSTEKKRFFAIGMNVHDWPQSSEPCFRYPTEKEFTSAEKVFTVLHLKYTTLGIYNQNCFGLPSYVTTFANDDAILMSGADYTDYQLRVNSSVNQNGGVLGPSDINNLETSLQNNQNDVALVASTIANLLDYSEANGVSDIIYWSQDEPEYGIRQHVSETIKYRSWHTSGAIIDHFKNEANDSALITYLDLGPNNAQGGNNFLYDNRGTYTIPGNDLTDYAGYNYFTPSWETTIKETVREYAPATDILGINSYSNTSLEPWKLGQLVSWIHEEASNIPVLPWVSAECPRYGTNCADTYLDINYYRNIRAQTYSSVINRSMGIMFWADSAKTSHERWDEVLDIAKELHYFKYIIENGSYYQDWHYTDTIGRITSEGLVFEINGDYIVFENEYDPIESTITFMPISGPDLSLSYPRNLGFEEEINENTISTGNWKMTDPAGTDTKVQWYNADSDNIKIGSRSLYLYDDSDTERVQVEQWFDIVPGYEYQARGWYKGVSGWQRMIMLFFSPTGYLGEHEVKNSSSTNGDWTYLESTPIEAPAGATRIKLHIGSKYENWNSITSEGYWDDVMVRIVGDGSSGSSKVMPQQEPQDKSYAFNLNQNYPNPFNPSTQIEYSVQNNSFVELSVYNISGQKVEVLVSENKNAGSYSVSFDASTLPSGIYIYELRVGNQVQRKKMTLIK